MEFYDDMNEFDDLDLLELLSSDSNSTNQYLVFHGSNNELYAINVAKVIEILVFKNLNMVRNGENDSLILASAQIRDEMATIINFDEWFGNKVLDESDYEFLIYVGFGGYSLGMMIKAVEYIVTIDSAQMQDNSMNNPKTNFVANIKLNGEERLCTVFDCDKLLGDIFDEIVRDNDLENVNISNNLETNKIALYADDSKFIRKMLKALFDKLEIKSKGFENGKDLLDSLTNSDSSNIGLIVSDLEMPIMDGIHLIKNIKKEPVYSDIPIIIHTNMSNFILEETLEELNIEEVIGKIDMSKLSKSIQKNFDI